jgi:hypothetical protein
MLWMNLMPVQIGRSSGAWVRMIMLAILIFMVLITRFHPVVVFQQVMFVSGAYFISCDDKPPRRKRWKELKAKLKSLSEKFSVGPESVGEPT